jgi:hypothetical protein
MVKGSVGAGAPRRIRSQRAGGQPDKSVSSAHRESAMGMRAPKYLSSQYRNMCASGFAEARRDL